MKISILSYFLLILILILQSCRESLTENADEWTKEIKRKIIEDSEKDPARLRHYYTNEKSDSSGKVISIDTVVSIFASADQQFELVRELCPGIERNFEGIRYKGEHMGLVELRYCDGKIKEMGYRFNGDIGIWQQFDISGKVIKEVDHGNLERLEKLKSIKYYR